MKRKAFFPKTLASLLAIAMLFAALPGIGSSALMQGTRSATFAVGKNAKEFEGTDGSVVLDKNAYLTANGTYSIELSAFVTGEDITAETVTITESKPVDIILVVDQSGSMQDSSGGYGHMTATKNTITSFLDGLTDAKLDHRIAIVGYSNGLDEEDAAESMYSNSPTLNPNYHNYRFRGTGVYDGANFYRYQEDGYTTPLEKGEVKDSSGKVVCTCNDAGLATDVQYANALKNLNTERATIDASINAITHYASTFMSYGLKMAQKIVDNRTEQDRPAVVILFTDGNPGNMGFSMKDAAASVNAATRLKKNDKVKIFTVGLLASSYFDDRHSFADGMGVTLTGMKKNSTSATAPIFPYSYEAPTNTRMFITDSTIRFMLSGGSWARQNTYSAVDNYPNEPWARDVWSMNYNGDMITTKQAIGMGIEENFLVRDLLCIISSDYENVSAGIYNMQEMYNTFGTGAAPTNDKTNAYNGTLPNGYLWPAYTKAANIGLIMDIGKCVAYYQEGTTNLVAGDYWRAALYNGTDYQFSYTDGVKDHAKKYYMMTDGHGDTEAANEALLKDVFNMIENVVTTEIVTGGGHPAGIDASTVLCDQLSDLFTLEDAQLSIKAYTQNYMGDESGKPSFATEMTEITNSLNVKFDRSTGKIAVSGFDYSANFVHYDENHQPKGCRLLVIVEGVLAKETTVGEQLPTNNEETSGLYPGADSEGSGTIPADSNRPGEYPANSGTPLTFPLPKVDIEEQFVVYDFSTDIQLHISDERDAVVATLGVPFAQIADNKGLAYTGSFTDGGINIEATLGRGDAIVEINAIEPDIRSAAALMHYKNDAFIVDGRNVEKFQWKRITVLPATNVHYEESFVTFENGISGASWSDEGRPVNAYQSAENRSYGFDASYGNYSQDSNGISKTVTVGKSQFGNTANFPTANFPTATFTFTGTGFDIMGRAGFNSGVYFVRILKNGSLVKSQIINTRYFGSGEGDEGAAVLYQVPVVSIGDLEYGEYTVETKFLWTPGYATRGENSTVIFKGEEYEYIALFDAPTTKGSTDELPSFDIYFDAVRIYNPTAPGNAVAKNAYTEAIEANPNYVELRKYLNEHNSDLTGGASANGAIAIDVTPHQVPKLDDNGKPVIGDDGKPVYEFVMPQGDEPFTMTDYMNFGPNNEMYIKNGNAFGFKVNTSTLASLQISAKSPFGASSDTNLKVQVASVSGGKDYTKSVSISSATEMFYDFSDLLAQTGIAGKEIYVVISAQGSGILSLCKLKLVSNDDIKAQISSDMDTVEYACAATAGTKGDVNADTTVDMLDALLSMRAALCTEALGVYGTYCADMNNDGFADVEDALNIIRTALEN